MVEDLIEITVVVGGFPVNFVVGGLKFVRNEGSLTSRKAVEVGAAAALDTDIDIGFFDVVRAGAHRNVAPLDVLEGLHPARC